MTNIESQSLKICFVFSPFSSFSYIPLGISYLKSFIKKELSFVNVKNIDLNSNFYHNLDNAEFLNCLAQLCSICPNGNTARCKGIFIDNDIVHLIKTVLIAKNYLTDPKMNEFYNGSKYNTLIKLYESFSNRVVHCITLILKHFLDTDNKEHGSTLEHSLFKDDINKIFSENPDIVGFSIFSEGQLCYSLALAKILKKKLRIKIIFGGALISHLDKKALLRIFDFIDFAIYKEGELGIASLLNSLQGRSFDKIPNLVYRSQNKIIENAESVVQNLDRIPFPDFSDYDLKKYFVPYPVVSTLFSRGCFWNLCTFCAHRKTYARLYRTRSILNFVDELESYSTQGIKYIWFSDEIIAAKDLDSINKALLKRRIPICYGVMIRPTKDFRDDIIDRMYNAGCRMVIWGVESFNQRILDLMNKGTNVKEIERVLRASHRVGIFSLVYMIRGFPTQTEKEILEEEAYLTKNSKYIDLIGLHSFWLEEGTAISRNPEKFKLRCIGPNYLINTKKIKLASSTISFVNKEKIDLRILHRPLIHNKRKYEPAVHKFYYGISNKKEHLLIYASSKSK